MPDHRLRGATAYSTNKSTLANRKRLGSMPTDQRLELRKKTSEYQAIWQLLNRVCRKDDYRRATRATQRTILQASCEALLEKRRREGKAMCAIDTATMIERHLKKESATRQFSRQTASSANLPNPLNLKGVALDPSPHASRDPLSPPGTPEEEEEEEGILDKGAEGGGEDFDFETPKSENDGEQRGQSMEDFDAALDAQLQGHSHFLMTNGILSSLQSQIRSLRKETASLRDRCDSLQRQITGDQYSNTDGDDDGMHDGMAAVARYNHAMYPFPSIQPFWTAAPCQPLQSHEQNGNGHAGGQEWGTVDGQQQQQQQHEGQMEGQQAQGDWVLLGPQPYSMG